MLQTQFDTFQEINNIASNVQSMLINEMNKKTEVNLLQKNKK